MRIEKDELNTQYNNYVQQHEDISNTLNEKNAEVEEMNLKMEEMRQENEEEIEQLNGHIQMLSESCERIYYYLII